MRFVREIGVFDIEKAHIQVAGRTWPTSGFIGRILPTDVGKKIFLVDNTLQVENDDQRAIRLQKDARKRRKPWAL
jgi:hypothetical protein